jgi:N utilization substance protein B
MGARRSGREAALQMLFSIEATGHSAEETISEFWRTFESDPEGREHAEAIVRGVQEHLAEIDALISKVSTNWRIERMSRVDRNLLRLATWELKTRSDIPRAVILDEAVELAKTFGSESSPAFVNGVLDAMADALQRT